MSKPHYRKTADGQILPAIRSADGFQNLVANLGTDRDKSFANSYALSVLTDPALLTAYRSSSVAKAVVDYPADDACREWRAWQATADQITKIEAEEKRLNIVATIREARIRARLYGGAAVFIGTGDADPARPLNPDSIRSGGLRYLTILDKSELGVERLQLNPSIPGYGKPEAYRLSAAGGGLLDIHPSRLVVFTGDDIPSNALSQSMSGWGDSVLQTAMEKVGHLDATLANVASLVFEAKVDVVKIKDFTQNLRMGGSAYETLMLRRFGLAMTAKGINGTLMLDGEEEYQQKSANFSTLPDIIDRFMQAVSAASGIPMTRLFGMSPAGMNATGESDLRNYYDRVKQEQTLDMEPAMSVLDECLIRSALGVRPTEIFYNWRPLWQLAEKDRAEIATKLVTAAEGVYRMEAAPVEAIGKATVNALTEIGAFPGLEAAVEEFTAGGAGEQDEEADPLTGDPVVASDAAPKPLYVRRNVVNAAEIIAWAKEQGFSTTLPADDMHVTVVFSRDAVDWMKVGQSWEDQVEVTAGGPRIMERFGDARVLLFACSQLSWRHEEAKRAGASWDHPEYQPHITISYAEDAPDIEDVKPYAGRIVLGPEIFEEVNPKWFEGVTET